MATLVARPQSLGKPRSGGAQTAADVLRVTRGQSYRGAYLERRRQRYEQILQFTMQEATWQMQADEFKRKQLAAMADDLMKQADGLRDLNASWAAGRAVNPRELFGVMVAAEDQNAQFAELNVRMPTEIEKRTQPTEQSTSHILTVDNAVDTIAQRTSVVKGGPSDFLIELGKELSNPGGSLYDIAEKIYVQEHPRGELVTRVAASDFADQIIKQANAKGLGLSGPHRKKIRTMVGTQFGGVTEVQIAMAKTDQATERADQKSKIPKTNIGTHLKNYLDAIDTGDVSEIEAALILERTQAAQALEAEAKKYREQAAKPIDVPTYEDILAKAAARQPPKKGLREQIAADFKKKKARSASKYLAGGGTPEQQLMMSASAEAIKTLRFNDGAIPMGDTLATREAETLFKQWKKGGLKPDKLPDLAWELAVASRDGEDQKTMQHDILTHFMMLKKTSQGGVGLPEEIKKEQERAMADEMIRRVSPTTDPASSVVLKDSPHRELFERVIEANRKQKIDPSLEGEDRRIAVEDAAAAREILNDALPGLVKIIPGADPSDANMARALAANILQDRGSRQEYEGDLRAANATRREANRFIYEMPEDYDWDSNIFSGYMQDWHQQQYQWKPMDYEPMVIKAEEESRESTGGRYELDDLDVEAENLPEEIDFK